MKNFKNIKTFEQFSSENEEVLEEGVIDYISGVRKYNLDTYKASKIAIDHYNDPKYKVTFDKMKKSMSKSLGLDDEYAGKALLAAIDFTKGATPMLNKYNIDYNKDTKELKINPNGKGLFNGHPIMG